MTEDEARQRWCPMNRNAEYTPADIVSVEAAKGQLTGVLRGGKCIGSQCMMWRWDDSSETVPHGYCGLAGKP